MGPMAGLEERNVPNRWVTPIRSLDLPARRVAVPTHLSLHDSTSCSQAVGHPYNFKPCPTLLNCGDRTMTGVFRCGMAVAIYTTVTHHNALQYAPAA